MSVDPTERPALDLPTVEDDEDLSEAILALIQADGSSSRRHAEIEEWLALLAACVNDQDVLRVADEVRVRVLAEAEELALAIARWAFAEGRRYAIPAAEGSS